MSWLDKLDTKKRKTKSNWLNKLDSSYKREDKKHTSPKTESELDKNFFDKQANTNYQSFLSLGMSEEKARENALSSRSKATPQKYIPKPLFGAKIRAQSYWGDQTVLERPNISVKTKNEVATRDGKSRYDDKGVVQGEVDHIINIGLGLADPLDKDNLKFEMALRTAADIKDKIPSQHLEHWKRQGGRLPAELKIIQKYQDKEITQIQALEAMGKLKKTEINPYKMAIEQIKEDIYNIPEKAGKVGGMILKPFGMAIGGLVGGFSEFVATADQPNSKKKLEDIIRSTIRTGKSTGDFAEKIGTEGFKFYPEAIRTTLKVGKTGVDMITGKEEAFLDYTVDEFIKNVPGVSKEQAKNYLVTGNYEGDVKRSDKTEIAKAWIGSLFNTGLQMNVVANLATRSIENQVRKNPKFKVMKYGRADFENGVIKTAERTRKGIVTKIRKTPTIKGKGVVEVAEVKPSFKTRLGLGLKEGNKSIRISGSSKGLSEQNLLGTTEQAVAKTGTGAVSIPSQVITQATKGNAALASIVSKAIKPIVKPQETVSEVKPTKTTINTSLSEQAKKAKSVEEFIKSQDIVYRGGKADGKYLSTSKSIAEEFKKERGGVISEYVISPEAKVADYSNFPNAKYKGINDYNVNKFSQGKDLLSFQNN